MSQTVRLVGDTQRELAKRLIDRAPPRAVVKISEEVRTLEQNSKFHAMLSDIARAKPMGRVHDSETWKCIFLDALGVKPRWVPGLDGEHVINTGYRSSKLTKAQMSEAIELMYAFGAEHSVRWSEPEREAA